MTARTLLLAAVALAFPLGLALAVYASSAGTLVATPAAVSAPAETIGRPSLPPTTTDDDGSGQGRGRGRGRGGDDRCDEPERRDDPECIDEDGDGSGRGRGRGRGRGGDD